MAFETRIDTIPHCVPYLHARPAKVKEWQEVLNGAGGLKVGLVWSGSVRVDRWQNASVDSNTRADVRTLAYENRRSIPLAALQPLFSLDISFVSLQKEVRDADREMMSRYSNLRDCSDRLRDFSDTAGMIENLDLVISVDTSVAHLAGAMAKPVWIMLSSAPDWRWLLERSDSPWYPTARLFRQRTLGDWDGVVRALGLALEAVLKTGLLRATNFTRVGPG